MQRLGQCWGQSKGRPALQAAQGGVEAAAWPPGELLSSLGLSYPLFLE